MPVDRVRRGDVQVAQVRRQGIRIERSVEVRAGHDRLELRGEAEQAGLPVDEQRLDAEPITNEVEAALLGVPQGDGEHAGESPDRRLDTPSFDGGQHHLGVGVASKPASVRLQLAAQLLVVVDLTVELDGEPAARRVHRLMAVLGQVDDRQPPEPECQPRILVDPHAAVVGTAMPDRLAHPGRRRGEIGRPPAAACQESG